MSILTVFLPLLNFFLLITFGRLIPHQQLFKGVIGSMVVLIILTVAQLKTIFHESFASTNLGTWIVSGDMEVDWIFSLDVLTLVMLIVVLSVSTLVHLYSTEYMSEDPHIVRFVSYLSLFTFFMLILITSANFVILFLGWEGVGLCSYLLISFWYTRIAANKAAIKAMVVNRVTDLAFTVGVLVIFYLFESVDFAVVFASAPYLGGSVFNLTAGTAVSPLSVAALLLFFGAMGKSAQIALHTWLPDAMEGPTPVSALIHAATMVTAGVFLIIRCSPLFECAPSVLFFMALIGAGTAFMAATAGLVQNDLKKVIAYSTCSQLGYMVFVCGLSGYTLSLFHLATHAFFKALLFLSAGATIHALSNEQDMRKFGQLRGILPYTFAMFLIGSLSLLGFPFLSGFYSKDAILELAFSQIWCVGGFTYLVGALTALFTSFYSFRLLHLVFYTNSRSPATYLTGAHELSPRMALSLGILAVGSVFGGYFARDFFSGVGSQALSAAVAAPAIFAETQLAGEFLPIFFKVIPLIGSCVSILLGFLVLHWQEAYSQITNKRLVEKLYRFLSHKWYFDTVYNKAINQPLLLVAYTPVFSLIDKGLLEFVGPTGLAKLSGYLSIRAVAFQTGRVYDYAWVMLLSMYLCWALASLSN